MRRLNVLLWAPLTALVLLLAQTVWEPPLAAAVTCPSSVTPDFAGGTKIPPDNELGGVRAPIELRRTGGVCAPGSGSGGFVFLWIGLEPLSGGQIVQAGWEDDYSVAIGGPEYCRFYAYATGGVHPYHCGDPEGTYVYWQIKKYWDPVAHVYRYDIADCGTANPTYANCTTKYGQQQAWGSEWALSLAEANFGQSGCVDKIMGSTSDKANIGTSANNVQRMPDYGGTWQAGTWDTDWASCPYYIPDTSTNAQVLTWDSRN